MNRKPEDYACYKDFIKWWGETDPKEILADNYHQTFLAFAAGWERWEEGESESG